MMRRPKVNDVVRSFVFGVRRNLPTSSEWPFPILGWQWENAMRPIKASVLVPFAAFAYSEQRNYIIANRQIIQLCVFLRDLAPEEQEYAAELMRRYYVDGENLERQSL